MPEYLFLLREASVASIYVLFLVVVILSLLKGRIKQNEFVILYYIWLPIALCSQLLMTYFRFYLSQSNLFIMNIYLMIEFVLFTIILLIIREKKRGIKTIYKIWGPILVSGILIHFIYDFNTVHSWAMLYIAIIYFQITIKYLDPNKVENFYTDPYLIFNLTVFVKAIGYSYFFIYLSDYRFPLSIYSGINIIVQILFIVTVLFYYNHEKELLKSAT